VNGAGSPQWTANGVGLTTNVTGDQQYPTITTDGAGGAIVTWWDTRNGNNDIFAQRVIPNGTSPWAANGKAVCTNVSSQVVPTIASDGAGGAIITWFDLRAGNWDVYAQRMASNGTAQWSADGVGVSVATGDQRDPTIISDGAGGAIITWGDGRNGINSDVYAQRVSPTGSGMWTSNGVALSTATGDQTIPVLVSDGSGGAIVTWPDNRVGPSDVYAQRVSSNGAVQWTANGVALCTAQGNQSIPVIASDGAGGAIVTWYDFRGLVWDIYAQRVTSTGVASWTTNGLAICTSLGDQQNPSIVSDGAGGAIVAWQDNRLGSNGYDIYVQRVERFGYLGPEPVIASVRDVPNDQGAQIKVSWYASYLDGLSDPNLTSYDLYRSAPGSLAFAAARQGARVSSSFAEAPVPGERSFVVAPAKSQLYAWEYVGSTPAVHFLNAYGYIASTTGDSIGGSNPPTIFMVVGRNSSGSMYWLSAPDSGYSVDNIAPAPPTPLLGTYSGGNTALHWGVSTEADFAEYRLYRGSSAGFVPGPGNLVTSTPDTGYVDAAVSPSYYKLSAVDSHGNQSTFALLTPSGTVDVPGADSPIALRLGTPQPNPARGATRIAFDLPREGHVSLAVYDPSGRRVRELFRGRHEEGRFSLGWDLRDDAGHAIASGMYFVRLEAMGRALTQRMVAMP